jgi:hypothetical protein
MKSNTMAKNKNKNVGKSKKAKAKANAPRMKRQPFFSHSEYQATLLDPCSGPVKSHYSGEEGICQRFVQDLTMNTAVGATAGFMFFGPASNSFQSNGAATSSAVLTSAGFAGPGQTFLTASASKLRAFSACVTLVPSAVSLTNMTGEIGVAIVSLNTIVVGGNYTVDGLFQLTQKRAVLAKEEYDVKWFPGGLDHTYAPIVSGAIAIQDTADSNGILLVYRGFPAAVPLSVRLTTNVEWTPIPAIGTAVSSVPRQGVDVHKEANQLHRQNPGWWHRFGNEIVNQAMNYGGAAVRYAAHQGVQYIKRAAPMMLTL